MMRETNKFIDIKRNIAWKLCTELLSSPVPIRPAAPELSSNASESEKYRKQRDYELKLRAYEDQYEKSEEELLSKLDEVIDRVKASQHLKPIDNAEVWLSRASVGEVQAIQFRCHVCGNKDASYFLRDNSSGDTICLGVLGSGCGNIVVDHGVDEGAQFRRFSDDEGEDRNHYGPAPDPLMPDSENLRTRIIHVSGSAAETKRLTQTSKYIEMNLSNIGNDERKTRTAYRNNMKREAFELMTHIAANLSIHTAVVNKAKEIFARYRDVKEHLHHYNSVVAACLVMAIECILTEEGSDVQPIFNKATYLSESYLATAASLGNPITASSSAAPKLLESDDPIVAMHKPQLTGQWSRVQVQQWLAAVFGNSSSAIENVLCALDEKINSNKSHKRKQTSSIFGTTTMANRNKRYQQAAHANSSDCGLTPGQALVRLAIEDLKIDDEKKNLLKAALRMRHTYETLLAERQHALELETRRLNAETASRLPTGITPDSEMRSTGTDSAIADNSPVPVSAADEDDLITSVLRVATEVKAEDFAEDKEEEPPKKAKRGRGTNIRFSVVEG